MTLQQLRILRDQIWQMAEQHGGFDVRVFGSLARGEATSASDVDLLIDLGPDRSLFDRSRLTVDLERLLGTHVDAVSSHGLHPSIRERILKEAIPL